MHYRRLWRYGDPTVVHREGWGRKDCSVDTCERPHSTRGFCKGHYRRLLVHGDVFADKPLGHRGRRLDDGRPSHLRHLTEGTRRVDGQGYVRVLLPSHPHATYKGGWAFEHRAVMADHIGRPLCADEIVHHKNGDRTDNRLENLELCVRRQPPGQRVSDLLSWAHEIIARYG